jgi:hypothetical protein
MIKTNKIHVGNFNYEFDINDVIKLTGIITSNIVCVDENTIPNTIKQVYTPQKNDKLYLYPECTIPRFKLKSFCDKYKVSIIRDINKADALFTKNTYMTDQYFNKSDSYPNRVEGINREYLINYLKIVAVSTYKYNKQFPKYVSNIEDFSSDSIDNSCLEYDYTELLMHLSKQNNKENLVIYDFVNFISDMLKVTDTFIYMDSNHSWKINRYGFNDIKIAYKEEIEDIMIDDESFMYFIDDEKEKLFDTLINHAGVYTEDSLLEQINSELEMDEDLYKGISNLFDSNSDDSIVIAMEAMANSNYKESAPYLLLLYNKYQGVISNSRTRNHVNFKGFLAYFNLHTRSSLDIYDIIERLINKNLLNTKNFKIIEPLLFDTMRNEGEQNTHRRNGAPYYVIDTIKPNEYIQNIIEKTDLSNYMTNNSTEMLLAETTNIEIL